MSYKGLSIAIIIPVFNGEQTIERAIRSVLNQTAEVDEIWVIDDSSTDSSNLVCKQLAKEDRRIKFTRNPKNIGPGGSRNVGIKNSEADWFFILDADDAFEPRRVERLLEAAVKTGADMIADLPKFYDLVAQRLEPRQLKTSGEMEKLTIINMLKLDPETGMDFGMLQPGFKRTKIIDGGHLYPEITRHGEDFEFYIELLRSGFQFYLLREAYYTFSQRIGAISGKFSPGSVTNVNYLEIAINSKMLLENLTEAGEVTSEIRTAFLNRIQNARRANRRYGWTVLRHGEFNRLWNWLCLNKSNKFELLKVILQKGTGKRGLPD